MKKLNDWKLILPLLLIISLLIGCSKQEASDKKTINIGFGPSTYVDQFKDSIQPILEQQGYKINLKIFSQNNQLNPALNEGAIDAHVSQSVAYMEDVNKKLGFKMVKLADTASAPQSIRSIKHKTLEEAKDGQTVAVPNDPINLERAMRIFESLGWVKVKTEGVSVANFDLTDVEILQPKLVYKLIDSAQGLRVLEDVDYAVINGNYVVNAKQIISDGLKVEKTPPQHTVIVSIVEKNLNTQWAKDLKAAYESPTFAKYIKSQRKYDGFILPKAWD